MGATSPATRLGGLLLLARESYRRRRRVGERMLSASGAGKLAGQTITVARRRGKPWASSWADDDRVTRHFVENSEAGRRNPLRDTTRLRGLVEGLEITPAMAIDLGLLEVRDRGRIEVLGGSAWLTALLVGGILETEDLNV